MWYSRSHLKQAVFDGSLLTLTTETYWAEIITGTPDCWWVVVNAVIFESWVKGFFKHQILVEQAKVNNNRISIDDQHWFLHLIDFWTLNVCLLSFLHFVNVCGVSFCAANFHWPAGSSNLPARLRQYSSCDFFFIGTQDTRWNRVICRSFWALCFFM